MQLQPRVHSDPVIGTGWESPWWDKLMSKRFSTYWSKQLCMLAFWHVLNQCLQGKRNQEDPGDPFERTPSSNQTRRDREESAVAEHAQAKQYHSLWDETAISGPGDQAISGPGEDINMLLIKEAFYITLTGQQKLLNRDQGIAIVDCWRPLLRCILRVMDHNHWPSPLTEWPHPWTLASCIYKEVILLVCMLWRRLQYSSRNVNILYESGFVWNNGDIFSIQPRTSLRQHNQSVNQLRSPRPIPLASYTIQTVRLNLLPYCTAGLPFKVA